MPRWFVRGLGIADGTGDVIAEIDKDGDPHFYLSNHCGDTIIVLNENASQETYLQYDTFGNVVTNTGSFDPKYTFSTKEYLSDCLLYLYAYRAYDPIAGRWTQRDPIDYQDSINLYQFCGNNPVNGIDILGLQHNYLNDDYEENFLNEIDDKQPVLDQNTIDHNELMEVTSQIIVFRLAELPEGNFGYASTLFGKNKAYVYNDSIFANRDSQEYNYQHKMSTVILTEGGNIIFSPGSGKTSILGRELNYHIMGVTTAAKGVYGPIGGIGIRVHKLLKWGEITVSRNTFRFYNMGRNDSKAVITSAQ